MPGLMKRAAHWVRNTLLNSGRHQGRTRTTRLAVEELEGRVVLTFTYGNPITSDALIEHVRINSLFLGDQWDLNPALARQKQAVNDYLSYLTQSTYLDMLSQFSVPSGIIPPHGAYTIGHGSFGKSALYPPLGSAIDKSRIQQIILSKIDDGALEPVSADTLYVVFPPPNTPVTKPGGTKSFGGFHASFPLVPNNALSANVRYAVIPYPDSPAANLNPLQLITDYASHEIAEAITDPDLGGWSDQATGDEVGDGPGIDGNFVFLDGYAVQRIANIDGSANTPQGAVDHVPWTGASVNDLTPVAGRSYNGPVAYFSATAYTPVSAQDLVATIDWNDGTAKSTVHLTGPDDSGYYAVLGTHTYTKTGSFKTHVSLEDLRLGATAAADSTAVVGLSAPTGLAPTGATTSRRPTFSWNAVAGAAFYDVWVNDTSTGASQVLRNETVVGTAWTPSTPLPVGDVFRWWVRAKDAASSDIATASEFSSADFTINHLPTPQPIGPLGDSVAHASADLTPLLLWSKVAGADSYRVQLNDNGTQVSDVTVTGADTLSWKPTAPLKIGHTYDWWVMARNSRDDGESYWSDTATFYLDLATPRLTSPSGKIKSTKPTLQWDPVFGADSYVFWVSDNATGDFQAARVRTNQATLDTPLIPGHSYSWWINAQTAEQYQSPWGGPLSFGVQTLDPPTLLGPTGKTNKSKPTFTWSSVVDATGYEIWVTENGSKAFDQVVGDVTTWVPPTSLMYGNRYEWWVLALNDFGVESDWSTGAAFNLTLDVPTLLGPSGNITNAKPTLRWNPVDGADSYNVYLANNTNGSYSLSTVKGTAGIPGEALVAGDSYSFWVQAQATGSGTSDWGGPMNFAIQFLDTPIPQAPLGTTSSTTPTLSWTGTTTAESYEVWLYDASSGQQIADQVVQGNATTTWTPPALTTGHSYQWWVRALNSSGDNSPWSATANFTINAAALNAPVLINPSGSISNTTPTLLWNGVSGADSYFVYLQDQSTGAVLTTTVTNTGAQINTPLVPGDSYIWYVRAQTNDGRQSDWSAPLTFTEATASQGTVTVTSVVGAPDPAGLNENVTFTATVTAAGSPVTSGAVKFTNHADGSTRTITLNSSGHATTTYSFRTAGQVSVDAEYLGLTNSSVTYLPSQSEVPATVTIQAPQQTTFNFSGRFSGDLIGKNPSGGSLARINLSGDVAIQIVTTGSNVSLQTGGTVTVTLSNVTQTPGFGDPNGLAHDYSGSYGGPSTTSTKDSFFGFNPVLFDSFPWQLQFVSLSNSGGTAGLHFEADYNTSSGFSADTFTSDTFTFQ